MHIRQCPVNKMTLCITSDPELEKCIKMKVIFGFIFYLKNLIKTITYFK